MSPHFLGSYLLAGGSVTPEQLARATAHQSRANRRLGEMAQELGLLTPEQVEDILRQQAVTDLSFGELALARGYLDKKSLKDLLYHQTIHQVHLGEALLASGALSPEHYHAVLERFLREEAGHQAALKALLAGYSEHQALSILLCALERAFVRFAGLPLKTRRFLQAGQIDALPHAFCLNVSVPEQNPIRCTLRMDDRMLRVLGSGRAGGDQPPSRPQTGPSGQEAVAAFFQVVAQYFHLNLPPLMAGASCSVLDAAGPLPGDGCLRLTLLCPQGAMGLVASCHPLHGSPAEAGA